MVIRAWWRHSDTPAGESKVVASYIPELTASLGGWLCGGPGGCSVGLLHSTAQVLSDRAQLRLSVRHCCTPADGTQGQWLVFLAISWTYYLGLVPKVSKISLKTNLETLQKEGDQLVKHAQDWETFHTLMSEVKIFLFSLSCVSPAAVYESTISSSHYGVVTLLSDERAKVFYEPVNRLHTTIRIAIEYSLP